MSNKPVRKGLRIGELSAQFGLNPKTLRYYEQLGLLDRPPRTITGHRLYDAAARDRLRFILKAKAIGLTLAEISQIVALQHQAGRPCQRVVALLEDKIAAVERQFHDLAQFRKALIALRDSTRHGLPTPTGSDICPIIEQYEPAQRLQASSTAAPRPRSGSG